MEHVGPVILIIALALAVCALLGACAIAVERVSPRRDVLGGLAVIGMKLYARLVHNLRVEGLEHVPTSKDAGPLIVVANHSAGVDPVLVQAIVPFEVRWLMAQDMQVKPFGWLWEWAGVIGVRREHGGDSRAVREALRHLDQGGVIGVFPEGGIARPRGTLRTFAPGVGLIVRKSSAPVLPVVIDGTPETLTAWGSLIRRSRSRIRFLQPVTYHARDKADAVRDDLQRRFLDATGWNLDGDADTA